MSDEEYVERVRHNVATWERWRKWLFVMYVALLLAVIGLCIWAGQFMAFFGQGPGLGGFVLGITVGSSLGFLINKTVQGVADSLSDLRNERLMLRYYDALHALRAQALEGPSRRLTAVASMGNDGH